MGGLAVVIILASTNKKAKTNAPLPLAEDVDELEEVKRDIRQAKADLVRAQERGSKELEWKVNDRLNLLLKEEERLATG